VIYLDRFYCVLEDKECIRCMECEICDLDENKVCDNCGKCIESESEFRAIEVDGIRDGIIED